MIKKMLGYVTTLIICACIFLPELATAASICSKNDLFPQDGLYIKSKYTNNEAVRLELNSDFTAFSRPVYDRDAVFYVVGDRGDFLPDFLNISNGSRSENAVLIKMLTKSSVKDTKSSYVALTRNKVPEVCNKGIYIKGTDGGFKLVTHREYFNHHLAVRKNQLLSRRFHFRFSEDDGTCIATYPEKVKPSSVDFTFYNIDGLNLNSRLANKIERAMDTSANAYEPAKINELNDRLNENAKQQYNGIDAKLAFAPKRSRPCVKFKAPVPTWQPSRGFGDYLLFRSDITLLYRDAKKWKPVETTILVGNLKDRKSFKIKLFWSR